MKYAKYLWCLFIIAPAVMCILDPSKMAVNTEVFERITIGMLCENALVAAVVLLVYTELVELSPTFFKWSPLFLVSKKWGHNIAFLPITIPYFGIVFIILILVTLPSYMLVEEIWFRRGLETWNDGAVMSFAFGMVHCLFGVPLAGGLALSILGLWLSHQYFLGGIELSVAHHSAYNTIFLLFLLAALVIRHGESFGRKPKTA